MQKFVIPHLRKMVNLADNKRIENIVKEICLKDHHK